MNNTTWCLVFSLYISTEAFYACSATTNTPPISSVSAYYAAHLTQRSPSPYLFERWKQELVPARARIMYDRFGPPSSFYWINAYDLRGYGIYDYTATYGKDTLFKIMGSAAREAAVQTLPLEELAHSGRRWGGSIWSSLIWGSIGNTEEEEAETVSATPSYNTLKHIVSFEWNELCDTWNGQYGWRPWRDNPYVYINTNFGHHEGRQFIRTELRCYGYLRPRSFGIIKTEARAIVALSKKSQLVFGGFAYPLEQGLEYESQTSLRIETYWRASLLSAGVATIPNGTLWNIVYEYKF